MLADQSCRFYAKDVGLVKITYFVLLASYFPWQFLVEEFIMQGCQKAPLTRDITGYFPSFAGYDLPVKREDVGGKIVLLPPQCCLLS